LSARRRTATADALNRLCATGYDGADCGPRIMSADRFGDRIFLKTCGHPLRVEPWKPLSASVE
jgi:hypothetical protein